MVKADKQKLARWVALSAMVGGYRLAVGERVQGKYQGDIGGANWFEGVVAQVYADGACDIEYDDGDHEERVAPKFVRVHVAGVVVEEVKAAKAKQANEPECDKDSDQPRGPAGERASARFCRRTPSPSEADTV